MKSAVRTRSGRSCLALSALALGACTSNPIRPIPIPDSGRFDAAGFDAGTPEADGGPVDAPMRDAQLDPDAACAAAVAEAPVERLPVDIIWVIDNSASMVDEIDQVRMGLNAFAARLDASDLDYRLIVLSLRGSTMVSGRFPICVPPPLAGPSCSDGPRFFHISVDIKSTQPIEQILGTLAQSSGYTEGHTSGVGGAAWRHLLRVGATKTIVVVTDDNARTCARSGGATCQPGDPPLTETSLEDFPGGEHPFNSRQLGPGIRTAEYGSLFEGYTFNAIYGWGSASDPDVACGAGASPGQTYTALVARTGGVRAQVCDGPSAWGPFFDGVADTVERTSRIECEIALPPPPDGSVLSPTRVNVQMRGVSGVSRVPGVADLAACDPVRGGWYYDDRAMPTRVFLCPATCDLAQTEVRGEGNGLDVLFGCDTIPI